MISKSAILSMLLLATLLLAGCAKMPTTNSRWAPTLDRTMPYSGYDADSKVSWQIANDAENLYVNLRSMQPNISQNILLNGMRIVVDTLGKKKGQFALKYPLGMNAGEFGKPIDPNPTGTVRPDLGLSAPREGAWIVGEDTTFLDNQKRTLGFDYDMRFDSLGTLQYRATIPLAQIRRTLTSTAPLVVGIVMKAGTLDTGTSSSNPGMNMAGNMPGGQTGVPGTGIAASRPSALPSGGSGTNLQEDAGSIKIWLGVKLNPGK